MITDIEVDDINLCYSDGDLISYHYSIMCPIHQSTPLQKCDVVSYGNVKQMDIDHVCKDVSESHTLKNTQ